LIRERTGGIDHDVGSELEVGVGKGVPGYDPPDSAVLPKERLHATVVYRHTAETLNIPQQ